jgi:arylformamidase
MATQQAPDARRARWQFDLVDLSRPVSEETAYGLLGDLAAGDDWEAYRRPTIVYDRDYPADTGKQGHFTIADHSATHLDAPVHAIPDGAHLEDVDLTRLIGEAVVLDMVDADPDHGYTAADFARATPAIEEGDIVLIYSGYRDATAETRIHQTYLTVEGARWLVDRRVRAVGCEPAGIEHVPNGLLVYDWYNTATVHGPPWPAHEVLLGNDVYIIEGLTNLEQLRGERVRFAALPALIPGLTGCPVRAVAWRESTA